MGLDCGVDFGAAEESLAAAVHGAGATAQTVQPGRWDQRCVGVADLPGGDPFTEADDLPVCRVGDAMSSAS